jgi:hypothetical protein
MGLAGLIFGGQGDLTDIRGREASCCGRNARGCRPNGKPMAQTRHSHRLLLPTLPLPLPPFVPTARPSFGAGIDASPNFLHPLIKARSSAVFSGWDAARLREV